MTNERAIELLHKISDSQFDGIHGDERREALSMAVRALSGDGDTISRQQAIDAVVSAMIDGADAELVEGVMELLPSAQPERLTDDDFETIRIHLNAYKEKLCNQQRWEEAEEYQRIIDRFMAFASAQPTQTNADSTHENTLDCVSRQEAIDQLHQSYNLLDAEQRLEDLPSAQPERKKGKWIWWYEEEFTEHATEYTPHCKCSECGRECAPSVATSSNFCRNCGADMRGESE